jgi:guanylate kinase
MSNSCLAPYLGKRGLVVVISGPSGVGKDAVLNRMKERHFPAQFITTVTTRRQRAVEKQMRDYHFISESEFEELLNNKGLLEYAKVYGNWYGVPRKPVEESLAKGQDVIIKVDVQGAATIKKILPEAVFIFIAPPSMEELARRLALRSSETLSDLDLRLKTADAEVQQIRDFDYIVFNHSNRVDDALDQIGAIIASEKCRARPREYSLP